jgi:hypothetical protein
MNNEETKVPPVLSESKIQKAHRHYCAIRRIALRFLRNDIAARDSSAVLEMGSLVSKYNAKASALEMVMPELSKKKDSELIEELLAEIRKEEEEQ